MEVSYKRDLNHNYLILQSPDNIDMESYNVRLLTGNHVAGFLQCMTQTVDNQEFLYYEITAKQSLANIYECRKMKREDLALLFDGLIKIIEEMQGFLLDAGGLLLSPEYVYLDEEDEEIFFCYFPVKPKEITVALRELAEYILPKIDHTDQAAVILGYNIYRCIMEDGVCLERIKKELRCESIVEVKKESLDLWEDRPEDTTDRSEELLQSLIEERKEAVHPAVSTIIIAISGIVLFIYFYFLNNTEFSWHIYVAAAVVLLILAGVSAGIYLYGMRAPRNKKEDVKAKVVENNYDAIEKQFENEFANIVQRKG